MYKRKNEKMLTVWSFAIIAVLTGGFITASANAQVDYVLMVQQTPAEGGVVTPEVGVHKVLANGGVKVTATPRPGYQFVYWLGDVSEPTSSSTVVAVNSPKIVVAVFQRNEYELPFEVPAAAESAGGGGGGLSPNRQYVGGTGDVSPATGTLSSGYNYAKYTPAQPTIPATTKPASQDDLQIPQTPEPATMLLLGVGSLLALKKKK
jgi:hypothetical protein